ncbi:unnamed protein product [Owenia fusiformis]|uniref:GRIP domain-containing protein n=1 Tax=Owenia fusiformis TaxID=6347 RepID=A0A8S4P306_OWEFU|nr:unnamed protein product [Owenia fusiformis]
MFAKLKKKIQEEGGGAPPSSPGEGEKRQLSPGPGLASPVADEGAKATGLGLFPNKSPSKDSEASAQLDTGHSKETKDEVLALLVKRTDQVKKLESKISELAALIKEKNKYAEKLEISLEKQQDESIAKQKEMQEDFKKKSNQMTESFTLALDKKDDDWKKKIAEIEKEKENLQKSLEKAEEYRMKYFKKEEESEEMEGLTTQELAKLKHMLLNKDQLLEKTESNLKEKTEALVISEKSLKELQNICEKLKMEVDDSKIQKQRCEEESQQHYTTILGLRAEKEALAKQLETATETLSQHAVDVEEKDSHIQHVQERVILLEQRLKDTTLSGDEHLTALQTERTNLEKKLEESRQQLTEVKSVWSEKISHLESQISNLNAKIVEDSEDFKGKQQEMETMKANFEKQIESLHSKLEAAETKVLRTNEIVDEKDRLLEKQKLTLENETLRAREMSSESEALLREEVHTLKSKITSLEHNLEKTKREHEDEKVKLHSSQDDYLEREIETERQITTLEDQLLTVKGELKVATKECSRISAQMQECKRQNEQLESKFASVEKELSETHDQYQSLDRKYKNKCLEYQECNTERDQLMLRNAELSQNCEHLKKSKSEEINSHQNEIEALQLEIQEKSAKNKDLEVKLGDLRSNIVQYQTKIEQQETKQVAALSAMESTEIQRHKTEISSLEDQLAEKNKAIKMQQQRLTDLKKTLQRELKVQSLPSDESNGTSNSPRDSPSNNRKFPSNGSQNKHTVPSIGNNSKSEQSVNSIIREKEKTPPAVIEQTTIKQDALMRNVVTNADHRDSFENAREHLDVNFEYLKHVVMKFMLSKETEAVHLIRAISILLKLNQNEQRLMKDTLEYKMSWFGSKPNLGKGQTAKVIPPSY